MSDEKLPAAFFVKVGGDVHAIAPTREGAEKLRAQYLETHAAQKGNPDDVEVVEGEHEHHPNWTIESPKPGKR